MADNAPCPHRKRSKIEDVIVCTECGVVISQDALVEGVLNDDDDKSRLWPELGHTQLVPLKTVPYANLALHNLIKSICTLFSIPSSVEEQATTLMDATLTEKVVRRGRAGRRAAVALIYLLARSSGAAPISISDISQAIGEATVDMFASVTLMRPFVLKMLGSAARVSHEPALFLEKQLEALDKKAPVKDKKQVLLLASDFCKLAEEHSLVEGRKCEAISFACVILALEALNRLPSKPAEYKELLKLLCDDAGVVLDTVALRVNELKDALIEEARINPLFKDLQCLKRSKIMTAALDILKHRKYVSLNDKTPPSYIKSSEQSKQRITQIQHALKRLEKSENQSGPFSIEDVIIERLLLHRVSAVRIEAASSLKQLLSLEDELFTEDLSNSD